MPRQKRHFLPGVPCHLIQRGNNRQRCFFAHRDYVVYLHKLAKYSSKFDVAIHSFVLMTNHVHLLLTPSSASGVSKLMQSLGACYVRYVNNAYGRTGTLWEGRFKASLVDSDRYLLALSRYIELNPVRAKMVAHPGQYPWSSYQANAHGKPIRLLSQHDTYRALGSSPLARQAAYQRLFKENISERTLKRIRDASNKACVLGNESFKERVERQLGCSLPPFPRGGDRRSAGL